MSARTFISSEVRRSDRPYLVVALTGGIGTGKSAAAARLASRGATVIDADLLARRVVAPATPGFKAIVARFGADFVAPDGTLDRRKLGERIFGTEADRRWLENTLHPLIRAEFEVDLAAAMREANASPPKAGRHLIVYVVPLLFEAGLPLNDFDFVVVIALDRTTACHRIVARDGMSGVEAERRIAAQLPIEEKVRRADFVITNTGTLEDLHRGIDDIATELSARAPRSRASPPAT